MCTRKRVLLYSPRKEKSCCQGLVSLKGSWLRLPLPEWYGSARVYCTGQAVCFGAEFDVKYMYKIDFFAFTILRALPFPDIVLKNFANFFVKSGVIFFLELLPKFDHVHFQIWAYFLLHFERTTKDNLNHYLLNLFVFRKEVSSVQWGKSTANDRSHGKIVLAIFSSILRTP